MSRVNIEEFVQAKYGTYTINDTDAHTGLNLMAIEVDADTVFGLIQINGIASDVRNTYISTIGGTVSKTLITPGAGNYFSGVTLVSGQITGLKNNV